MRSYLEAYYLVPTYIRHCIRPISNTARRTSRMDKKIPPSETRLDQKAGDNPMIYCTLGTRIINRHLILSLEKCPVWGMDVV
jgi:hypothetical protein